MIKTLGETCEFYTGTGFPNEYQGEKTGEYPFYKVGDISKTVQSGHIWLNQAENYISDDVARIIKGKIVPEKTIVFAKIGEALKLNRRAITTCESLIDNNTIGIKPDSKWFVTEYFFYYMRSLKMQNYAESTTVPSVRKSNLEKIEVFIPPIEGQELIVKKLSSIENIINNQKKQLSSLDELIKARFVELFGDLVFGDKFDENKCKIGDIASVTKLAGFEFTKYIKYKEQGDIIMLRGLNCKKGHLILDDIKWIDKETSDLLPRSKLYFGDILMTYAGTIGDVAMVDADDRYHLAPNVAKITLHDKKECNPLFLIHLFMYSHDYIMTFASQVAQASINMEKIRNFEYFFPPISLQNDFAAFVEQVDKSKVAVQKALDEAQLLFDSLMQKYFG